VGLKLGLSKKEIEKRITALKLKKQNLKKIQICISPKLACQSRIFLLLSMRIN